MMKMRKISALVLIIMAGVLLLGCTKSIPEVQARPVVEKTTVSIDSPTTVAATTAVELASAFMEEQLSESAEVVFYVVRHGKTEYNSMHQVQGWVDSPLTEDGMIVAQQLGKGLLDVNFVAAYSSELGRARDTARIVLDAKGQSEINITEYQNLKEHGFGMFEGGSEEKMWGIAAQHLGYKDRAALMGAFDEVGFEQIVAAIVQSDESGVAETVPEVRERTQTVLKEIASNTARQGGGNVLLVSHGWAISSMISDLVEIDPIAGRLANASVTKIIYQDGVFTVESIGDMSYAEKGALE